MSGRSRGSVLIVGGGASGVILAAHLLRSDDPGLRVTLIEREPHLGRGLAYSTVLPEHVLNVSAMGMSALADEPRHFWRWLHGKGLVREGEPPFYAPRSLYGAYLGQLLDGLVEREAKSGRLRLVHEAAVGVVTTSAGVEVELANGASLVGHVAVLAAGHDQEPAPEQAFAVRLGAPGDTPIDPDAPVLILGTGLSMVDAWLTLQHRGHRGPVHAVSRRGLLPSPHQPTKPIRLDSADIPLGTELSYFVRWFRELLRDTRKRGGDWRDVVDGLRPYNQRIWQSWPASAKRRFVEHTKAWWDIHRHRMAPVISGRVNAAIESGRLKLLAGRVVDATRMASGSQVGIQLRKGQELVSLDVAQIYDCTGLTKDVSAGSIAVVRSLTDRGLGRPDPLRLGLDVTPDCAVIAADGAPQDKLFAIGPLTRGAFFEIDAIPDIRAQCARLADRLAPAREKLSG